MVTQADDKGTNVLPMKGLTINLTELEDELLYEERWSKLKRSIRKFLIDNYTEEIPADPLNVKRNFNITFDFL